MPKIDALEKQITTSSARMLRDCEATLTPAQKKMLEELTGQRGRGQGEEERAPPSRSPERLGSSGEP